MMLRRGKVDNLTGNAVVYWDIVGENEIAPGYTIFAVNFTVSPLPLDNKLLTATFPPIPYRDFDELFEKLSLVTCDIIYGGELMFPSDQEAITQFYKSEFAKYNKVIEEYVDLYKERFNLSVNNLTEIERLDLLKEMSKKVRIEIREGAESKKMGGKKKIIELIKTLESSKYDVKQFQKVLFIPGDVADQLVSLYTKKFFAIYNEKYEDASQIKDEITKLEDEI